MVISICLVDIDLSFTQINDESEQISLAKALSKSLTMQSLHLDGIKITPFILKKCSELLQGGSAEAAEETSSKVNTKFESVSESQQMTFVRLKDANNPSSAWHQ